MRWRACASSWSASAPASKLAAHRSLLRHTVLGRKSPCVIISFASAIRRFYAARRRLMPVPKTEKIWHNGKFIHWDDAKIHVLSHVIHYGSGVFGGIRCYETTQGPAV